MDTSKPLLLLLCGMLISAGLPPPAGAAAAPDATSTVTNSDADAAQDRAAAQALADRQKLEQAIIELEAPVGNNAAALSEAHLDLANALSTLNLHEEALASYGNAVQALRVNNGLYDLQQIPILERQALAQEKLQRWEDADATRHLVYHIARKQLPAGAPPRFDALLQLTRWKFKAAEELLLPNTIQSEYEAAELYRIEISEMQQAAPYTERNIQLGLLYLELAAVEYQQAKHKYALPITAYQTSVQRSVSRLECQTMRLPDGRTTQVCQNVELPNMEYYMGPTLKKNQEVGQHLSNMKDAVLTAFQVLQQDTAFPADRDELLQEAHKLTNAYNTFTGDNSGRR